MCIRDSDSGEDASAKRSVSVTRVCGIQSPEGNRSLPVAYACLLYTSDAADERSSVDLGGRRIIKKKKHMRHR